MKTKPKRHPAAVPDGDEIGREWVESLRAVLAERKFRDLPRKIEAIKYDVDRIERELSLRTKRKELPETLLSLRRELEHARIDLAASRRALSAGERPTIDDWEVELAAGGLAQKMAAAAAEAALAEIKRFMRPKP